MGPTERERERAGHEWDDEDENVDGRHQETVALLPKSKSIDGQMNYSVVCTERKAPLFCFYSAGGRFD